MQAVVMRDGGLVVDEVPDRPPLPGQVVAKVLACGICGSDLHALHHTDRMVEMSELSTSPDDPMSPAIMDPSHDVVMGHEFCAEVLETGENVGNCRPGDVVVSMPIVFDPSGIHPIGYSNAYPGGYAEQLVLADVLSI
jgi:threonine dehydrogenase-like Zn-dependent dehydrogenase